MEKISCEKRVSTLTTLNQNTIKQIYKKTRIAKNGHRRFDLRFC